MPDRMYRSPSPDQLWEQIRDEFGLPSLEQVRERLSVIHEDPAPVMQQLVRFFLDDSTFCPGFQFGSDLSLKPLVLRLFERAMELRIAHNYFALWMTLPCPALQGGRPVDVRKQTDAATLLAALEHTLTGRRAA